MVLELGLYNNTSFHKEKKKPWQNQDDELTNLCVCTPYTWLSYTKKVNQDNFIQTLAFSKHFII